MAELVEIECPGCGLRLELSTHVGRPCVVRDGPESDTPGRGAVITGNGHLVHRCDTGTFRVLAFEPDAESVAPGRRTTPR